MNPPQKQFSLNRAASRKQIPISSWVWLVVLTLSSGTLLGQGFIGNLNGISNDSTFEIGASAGLPAQNWVNVIGTAQVYDAAEGNGALVYLGDGFANYQVRYSTGIAVQPNTIYTLHFDMGFLASFTGGNASYSFQLGTINGNAFTGLGGAVAGTAIYAGNLTSGFVSASAQQIVATGGSVSGDSLAVVWQQIGNPGPSDYFGFDNVTLSANPVPEPGTLSLILMGSLVMHGVWRKKTRH